MTEGWNQYKPAYERYLRPGTLTDDESMAGEEMEQEEIVAAKDSLSSADLAALGLRAQLGSRSSMATPSRASLDQAQQGRRVIAPLI
jgi:hypothetical protein